MRFTALALALVACRGPALTADDFDAVDSAYACPTGLYMAFDHRETVRVQIDGFDVAALADGPVTMSFPADAEGALARVYVGRNVIFDGGQDKCDDTLDTLPFASMRLDHAYDLDGDVTLTSDGDTVVAAVVGTWTVDDAALGEEDATPTDDAPPVDVDVTLPPGAFP